MGGAPIERCPNCGTRADAERIELLLPPTVLKALRRNADVVRHELGIDTDAEAIAESVRRLAYELNQGEPSGD